MASRIEHAVVTGATGMIGIALIDYLLSQGACVTALIRKGSKRAGRLSDRKGLKKNRVGFNGTFKGRSFIVKRRNRAEAGRIFSFGVGGDIWRFPK